MRRGCVRRWKKRPSEDKLCKDCRNWAGMTAFTNEAEDEFLPGECMDLRTLDFEDDKTPRGSHMAISNPFDAEVFMQFGPEFGCVHWKGKEREGER